MGQLVNASKDESGRYTGGKAGDQSKKEVYVRDWYQRGWTHMCRYSSVELASEVAYIGVKLANSNLVGYDQNQRLTLYTALKKYKWDVDKYIASGEKTECDCSSFVYTCYCCALAKLRNNRGSHTSSTLAGELKAVGFKVYTDSKFLTSSSNLRPGDVLIYAGHHVAMYVGKSSELDLSEGSGGGSGSGSGGSSGGSGTPTNTPVILDRNNAILREVGYLSTNLEPSITASGIHLLLVNTANSAFGVTGSEISSSGVSYNIDKLSSKQKTVITFLTGKGMNLAGSIGILANIEHESPGINTAAVGDNGTSFGICQWHNERGANMKSYVGSNWRTNLTGQLKFLWSELSSGYKSTLQSLKKSKDTLAGAKSAANIFVRQFEKPANVDSESNKRQTTAESLWKKCSISQATSNNSSSGKSSSSGTIPDGKPKKTVKVPESVKQSGISTNSTNYVYWFPKFTWTCRKLADIWHKQGRKHDRGIATISGYYLAAVSPVFGNTGDIIRVILKDNTAFSCIVADVKGSDKESKWGHMLSTGIDIIEWYIIGKSTTSNVEAEKRKLDLSGWRGKKVAKIENYGQYWGLKK